MEECSTGPSVPAVKPEVRTPPPVAPADVGPPSSAETDADYLCPICMQIIKDAFLTACGHSFCYLCIVTHLRHKSDCPCCGRYLNNNQLFPNFLLDKLLKKISARQKSETSSPVEQFCQALQQMNFLHHCICSMVAGKAFARLTEIENTCNIQAGLKYTCGAPNRHQKRLEALVLYVIFEDVINHQDKAPPSAVQRCIANVCLLCLHAQLSMNWCHQKNLKGCEVSVKEIDTLLALLAEKKRKLEQEEAERNMQILLDFLHGLRKQKVDELNEIQNDLQFIKEDINAVERHRIDLYRARDRYSVKLHMLADDSTSAKAWPSSVDKNNANLVSSSRNAKGGMGMGSLQYKKVDGKVQVSTTTPQRKDSLSGLGSEHLSQSGLTVARKKRVQAQFNDLQECYLQKRRQPASKPDKQEEWDKDVIYREGYTAGLSEFQSVLTTFTQYSRLRVIAELRHGDLFHSANIVSSIEFDRDDELFATAGVSRRIKVFDFSTVVNDPADVHCPVVEMPTRSKLSCLSWNKFTKNHIASSDYEGIVTVWDVTTRQSIMEYEEHEKRAWSVDFSHTEPSMLVSGSDDCKVKVWCTKQEPSVINIDMKANICSVKYNPGSSIYVAVGSADHHIHYYDLRNTSNPLHVFSGHKKTVSYVKFLSNDELASASTDSTLRLWDVKENLPICTFRGHMNEKNFVGLSVNNQHIACGSETNEVFVYHKAISRPVTWHRFGSPVVDETEEDAGSYFISAVCWKSDSPTMLAANSQGTIKVLVLAA